MHTQRCEYVGPLELYDALRRSGKSPFILESSAKMGRTGGYTYVSSDPEYLVDIDGEGTMIDGSQVSGEISPFEALKKIGCPQSAPGSGFARGYVGNVAYDAVHAEIGGDIIEPSRFGYYPDTFVYDHTAGTLIYLHAGDGALRDANDIVDAARQQPVAAGTPRGTIASCDTDQSEYCEMVTKAKEYVKSGDVFQVVLSREYRIKTKSTPFEAYCRLRETNPSPYLFLIEFEEKQVAGSSPETFAKVESDTVIINPIAGTIGRGASPQEDNILARRLLADGKERAEHVMLVDLARNDARKVSVPRGVSLSHYMDVVPYARVQHIESEVVGRLSPGTSPLDALAAAFPAGTLSGAPKVRAMEIIDELEQSRRRAYGGGVGYVSTTGDADMAIAIRMIEMDTTCRIRAGAGIVADSDPSKEYEETERKMSAVLDVFKGRRDV